MDNSAQAKVFFRPVNRQKRKGFLIVDLLGAIAFFVFVVAGIVRLQVHCLQLQSAAEKRSQIVTLVRSRVSRIIAGVDEGGVFGCEKDGVKVSGSTTEIGDNGFSQIFVVATWNELGITRTATFTYGFVKRGATQ